MQDMLYKAPIKDTLFGAIQDCQDLFLSAVETEDSAICVLVFLHELL